MKGVFDYLLAFFLGFVLMGLISSVSLAANSPTLLMIIAFMSVGVAVTAIAAYCFGRRHEKQSNLVAYHRGVTYGRRLGRAEKQSEIQNFLEEDK
ncbi:MAG: hypothetical protein J6A16_09660 [Oscillospiraceae bacterium]|nr:hypothetical protein [Oscillospiraceae bacterium]